MIRTICDIAFMLVCLISITILRYNDEITTYQFTIGMMILYGLSMMAPAHTTDKVDEETK